MNGQILQWLSPVVTQHVALALLHFLWQGTVVALVVALILRLFRDEFAADDEAISGRTAVSTSRANLRYTIACAGLLTMAVLPIVSLLVVEPNFEANAGPDTIAAVNSSAQNQDTTSFEVEPDRTIGMSLDIPVPQEFKTGTSAGPATLRAIENGAESAESPIFMRPVLQAFFWIWIVGVALLSSWHVVAWLLSQRLRYRGATASEDVLSVVKKVGRRLGIRRAISVRQTVEAAAPMVIGWVKPVLVLPMSVLTGLLPAELEAVLAHELAHIRRHDYLVNLLQAVIETVLFYHPAVWWLSRRIRHEREFCADDLAMGVCQGGEVYARSLVSLAEIVRTAPAHSVAATGGRLAQRIRRVMRLSDQRSLPVGRGRSALVVAAVFVCLSGALAVAQIRSGDRPASDAEGREGSRIAASPPPRAKDIAKPVEFGRIEARVAFAELRYAAPADPFALDRTIEPDVATFRVAAIQLRVQDPATRQWQTRLEVKPDTQGLFVFENVPAGLVKIVPRFEPKGCLARLDLPVQITAGETTRVTYRAPVLVSEAPWAAGDRSPFAAISRPNAEYNLPVHMRIVMDQQGLPDFLVHLANNDVPVEVTFMNVKPAVSPPPVRNDTPEDSQETDQERKITLPIEIFGRLRVFDPPPSKKPKSTDDEQPGKQLSVFVGPVSSDQKEQDPGSSKDIEAVLKQSCELTSIETPLQDLIPLLVDRYKVQFVIDRRALDESHITGELPVTLSIDGHSLAEVLDYLAEDFDLTWCVKHNVVLITTPEAEKRMLSVRVYKLRNKEDMKTLITELTVRVSPTSWDSVGGPGSVAVLTPITLAVAQTYQNHRRIRRLFSDRLQAVLPSLDAMPIKNVNIRILKELNRPTNLNVTDMPLGDAVAYLANKHQMKITLDEKALLEVGLATDVPITRNLNLIPLRSVLSLMLRDLDLAWVAEGNEIRITTPEVAETELKNAPLEVEDLKIDGDTKSLMDLMRSTLTRPFPKSGSYDVSPFVVPLPKDTPKKMGPMGGMGAGAAGAQKADSSELRSPDTSSWEHIDAAMKQTCELDFRNERLRNVLGLLADHHQLQFVLDRQAMDDAKVGADSPVTLNADGMSVAEILDHLTEDLHLAWRVKDNVVLITREMWPSGYVRVYNLQNSVNVANLIGDLTRNVSFDTWEVVGGGGSLAPFGADLLVVQQISRIQRQIEERYSELRPMPPVWDALPPTLADTHVGSKLNRLSSLDVNEMSLEDVLAQLAKKHEVTITLDKQALENAGISERVPVTRRLADIPLRSILSLVLRDLDLVWSADRDEIRITTRKVAKTSLQRIHYLTQDLAIEGETRPIIDVIQSTIAPNTWGSRRRPRDHPARSSRDTGYRSDVRRALADQCFTRGIAASQEDERLCS